MELPNIYKGNYKLVAIVPILLILASLFFIPKIELGVDFRGGTLISLNGVKNQIQEHELENLLKTDGLNGEVKIFDTTIGKRAEVEFEQSENLVKAQNLKEKFQELLPKVSTLEVASNIDNSKKEEYLTSKNQLIAYSNELFDLAKIPNAQRNYSGLNTLDKKVSEAETKVFSDYQNAITKSLDRYVQYESISIQTVSPLLSVSFIEKATNTVIFSGILSIVLVFMFFRRVVPSMAVIIGAAADVVIAMGAMGLLGIPFTLQSFAALLMLIGFSLDTDILLTTRILKRKGDPRENAYEAMKTGLTMSITAIISFGVLFILSILTNISVYYEISAVALAGLFGDMFATWGINGVIVLMDAEKRGKVE